MGKHTITVVLLVALLSIAHLSEARRTVSSGRRGGSSSSSSSRRTSHSSNSGHVTKPTFQQSQPSNSHSDLAKLSYSGYNQQPNRPAQTHAASAPASNSQPIGWNVPKHDTPAVAVNKAPVQSAGPPPAYSPHNVQGARTNMHEAPPPYSAVGGYPAPAHSGLPAGAVLYPAGTNVGGHQPAYYPQQSHGMYPQQPGYHPAAGGGGYPGAPPSYPHSYPGGGASGYPAGGFPAASPPVYQGAAIQPGFYPAGSVPIGAQQSSGPGFGSGILAGALGGAILGHVLTPSGGGGSNHGSSDDGKVVIINNNPGAPAAVVPAAGVPAAPVAGAPAAVPVAPAAGVPLPPAPDAPGVAPGIPVAPGVAPVVPIAAGSAAMVPNSNETSTPTPLAPIPGDNSSTPAPVYGLMCVPVMVNVTDPANPANVTVVEQIACYNVTQPPPPPQPQPEMIAPQPVYQQPQLAEIPPPTQKTSTATIAESANIKSGSMGMIGMTSSSLAMLTTTIATLIIPYCL